MTHPVTGKKQVALCIDNFYGRHKYGYAFLKDGSDAKFTNDYIQGDFDVFSESEMLNNDK
jgi:hypothetical protein